MSTVPATIFKGRRGAVIENDHLRVTVLQEGGHIAEILDKLTELLQATGPSYKELTFNMHNSISNDPSNSAIDL